MMRPTLALLSLIALCACASAPESEIATAPPIESPLLEGYLQIQEALAADDFETARAALAEMEKVAQADLLPLIAEAAAASDLAALRSAFIPLSAQAIEAIEIPAGVVTVYCPMADQNKGARWLQRQGSVANPYYGTEMLECGAVESPES